MEGGMVIAGSERAGVLNLLPLGWLGLISVSEVDPVTTLYGNIPVRESEPDRYKEKRRPGPEQSFPQEEKSGCS
jgi:hypothetical protein